MSLIVASRLKKENRTAGAVPRFRPYSDEPISSDKDDILGRVDFVDGLYRQIEALPFPDSFVIGLYAGWGEGKTSVLNLLAQPTLGGNENNLGISGFNNATIALDGLGNAWVTGMTDSTYSR